jgi:hypothetical protein
MVRIEFLAGSDFRAAENGEVEFVEWEVEPFLRCDQFPGVGDGVLFEIIAEGKIAEHLKKGVMAIGEADVFEIVVLAAGADAFLAGGCAVVVALLEAEENVLELVHAGVGEEQRGIVGGDERGAAHDAVAAFREEAEEGCSDFVTGHRPLIVLSSLHAELRATVRASHIRERSDSAQGPPPLDFLWWNGTGERAHV